MAPLLLQSSMPVELTCRACKNTFSVLPRRANKAVFCSRLCCYGPPTMHSCERCGKPFRISAKSSQAGNGRFCSHACRWAERPRTVRNCKRCGESFVPPNHKVVKGFGWYCSAFCHRGGTLAERFVRFVNTNGPTPEHCPALGPCHVWTGSVDRHGYGQIQADGRLIGAHRVAFFLAHGRWPEPCALHKCDGGEIGCVRADHLVEGTFADNTADMVRKGRGRGGPPRRATGAGLP